MGKALMPAASAEGGTARQCAAVSPCLRCLQFEQVRISGLPPAPRGATRATRDCTLRSKILTTPSLHSQLPRQREGLELQVLHVTVVDQFEVEGHVLQARVAIVLRRIWGVRADHLDHECA